MTHVRDGKQVYQLLFELFYCPETKNDIHEDLEMRRCYHAVVVQAFEKFLWLSSFQSPEEFEAIDRLGEGAHAVRDVCIRRLSALNRAVMELYPASDDEKLKQILWYMLEHVDGKSLQKKIASAFFMSGTTLSELFQCRLGMSYQEYGTNLKMKRAEYLLTHSDLKIYEISALLGYKDTNYFSRIFKQRYHVPLSAYRNSVQRIIRFDIFLSGQDWRCKYEDFNKRQIRASAHDGPCG